ncbi:MAG: hypothetical protein U5N26_08630 [Candidatus Marinimicrobia bacterium]|nr:hypothetical protein [Candidatus Neomarinimicrobiota bacterium]
MDVMSFSSGSTIRSPAVSPTCILPKEATCSGPILSDPSHIDHILITSELFEHHHQTQTLLYDTYLEGRWSEYHSYISDHRPVSVSLIIAGTQEGAQQ